MISVALRTLLREHAHGVYIVSIVPQASRLKTQTLLSFVHLILSTSSCSFSAVKNSVLRGCLYAREKLDWVEMQASVATQGNLIQDYTVHKRLLSKKGNAQV